MRPFTMTCISSATASASFMFCSTNRIVTPCPAQQPDHPGQLAHHQRRQSLAGLIQQQHFRIADQRARDRQHLLLAARQVAAAIARAFRQRRKQFQASVATAMRVPACVRRPGCSRSPSDRERSTAPRAHKRRRRAPRDAAASRRCRCHPASRARRTAAPAPSRSQRRCLAHAVASQAPQRCALAAPPDRRPAAHGWRHNARCRPSMRSISRYPPR